MDGGKVLGGRGKTGGRESDLVSPAAGAFS
jgi:hypothetical protein